jgi:predicted transcriptional regulator of viral defense system
MAGNVVAELARTGKRVFRPRDLRAWYRHPAEQMPRLLARGMARRLAPGYYVVPPLDRWGDGTWRPDLHAAALSIAQADYGRDAVALMGVSAARLHGAIPREIAVAVVAVPNQRPALTVAGGRVVFVRRAVDRLDVEAVQTELATGWLTTAEQTVVDLLDRPELGSLPPPDVAEAVRNLRRRASLDEVERIARRLRKTRVLAGLDR